MTTSSQNAGLTRAVLVAALIFFTTTLLVYGAGVFVPLAISVLVWFLINAVSNRIQGFKIGGAGLPRLVALGISFLAIIGVGMLAANLVVANVSAMSANVMNIEASLNPWIDKLADWFGLSGKGVLNAVVDQIGIEKLLGTILSAMAGFASQLGVVLVYVLFLLVEQQFFGIKLNALVRDEAKRQKVQHILSRIDKGIQDYLRIMTLVSLLTAILAYNVMYFVGLEQAAFWAFLIFVLNFIPTIGSILSTLLPSIYALVQFQAIGSVATVFIAIGAIQFVVGNILQPRLAGRSLNLSQFVIVLSLFVWGAIWGVTGMFLAVPLTAIVTIILSNFEKTRSAAILLSETGELDPINE